MKQNIKKKRKRNDNKWRISRTRKSWERIRMGTARWEERREKGWVVCWREISPVFQSVPLSQRLRISWSKARRSAAVVNESRGSSRYSYTNRLATKFSHASTLDRSGWDAFKQQNIIYNFSKKKSSKKKNTAIVCKNYK